MNNIFGDMNPVLQMLVVMTLFSLIPFVFACMTSFLRFVVVFSMLKTAMGTQQVPPSVVIIGLSMISCCLKVYILNKGKLITSGSQEEIKNQVGAKDFETAFIQLISEN